MSLGWWDCYKTTVELAFQWWLDIYSLYSLSILICFLFCCLSSNFLLQISKILIIVPLCGSNSINGISCAEDLFLSPSKLHQLTWVVDLRLYFMRGEILYTSIVSHFILKYLLQLSSLHVERSKSGCNTVFFSICTMWRQCPVVVDWN